MLGSWSEGLGIGTPQEAAVGTIEAAIEERLLKYTRARRRIIRRVHRTGAPKPRRGILDFGLGPRDCFCVGTAAAASAGPQCLRQARAWGLAMEGCTSCLGLRNLHPLRLSLASLRSADTSRLPDGAAATPEGCSKVGSTVQERSLSLREADARDGSDHLGTLLFEA